MVISARRNIYRKQYLSDDYSDEEWENDLEELHRLQFNALKQIINQLKLPYDLRVVQIEQKEKTWGAKHRETLRCFSRRLRRATPSVLKSFVNKNIDPEKSTPDERLDFDFDMSSHCPEPDEGQPVVFELLDEGLISPKRAFWLE